MEVRGPAGRGSGGLSLRSMVAIAAFGLSLSACDLGRGWALTYHEAFFAEPAREMLRSGGWLVPRVAGIPSWQKPPLTHWMIAASMALFRTEAEWAVRLPSVIAMILNALFVAAIAARIVGDRAGRWAGLIQLTSYSSLFMGRLAEADMPLCAVVSGGFFCLAVAVEGPGDRRARLGYFVAAGVSSLIKGPVGPAILGGAGLLYALVERRRVVWRTLFDPVGLALLAIVGLAWPLAAYRADPTMLDAWRVHNLDRFTGVYDGSKNPFFYAYIIPAILLPWTPLVVGGLMALLRDRDRRDGPWRLLACWAWTGMLLIQASAWKHKHYAIPMLPPATIVAAYGLARYVENARRDGRSPAGLMAGALGLGGLVAVAYGAARGPDLVVHAGLMAWVAGFGLVWAQFFRRMGRIDLAPACLFATLGVIVIGNQVAVLPRFDLYRPQAEMARRINERVPRGETICLVEIPSPQVVYYLRHPLARFDDREEFGRWLGGRRQADPVYVVGPRATAQALAKAGGAEIVEESVGWNSLAALRLVPDSARLAARPAPESPTARR